MPLAVDSLPLCPLAGLQSLFLVTKRKPLNRLPKQKQYQIRQAYRATGWASDYSVEFIGIYSRRDWAEHCCRGRKGYFITELPLNSNLPDETCHWRCQDQPAASASVRRFQRARLKFAAVPVAGLTNEITELS